MTRIEWLNSPRELQGWDNYWLMRNVIFKYIIQEMKIKRPEVKIVLHHYDYTDSYENWKAIPMYHDDHVSLHSSKKSEETRKKASISMKGKNTGKKSKESIAKGIKTRKENNIPAWNKGKGKKHIKYNCKNCNEQFNGAQSRVNISLCKNCLSTNELNSLIQKGREFTDEHKMKLKENHKGNVGKKATIETRKKQSVIAKNRDNRKWVIGGEKTRFKKGGTPWNKGLKKTGGK